MPIFELARRPPQWLRVALAALMLGFALNSIAHVAHQHEPTTVAAAHGPACGYCASFGGLTDAPRHTYVGVGPTQRDSFVATLAPAIRTFDLLTSAHPRAPPVS